MSSVDSKVQNLGIVLTRRSLRNNLKNCPLESALVAQLFVYKNFTNFSPNNFEVVHCTKSPSCHKIIVHINRFFGLPQTEQCCGTYNSKKGRANSLPFPLKA